MSKNKKNTSVEKREATYAERFVTKVRSEFSGSIGHGIEFTDYQKKLASNLFMKIDSALKSFEADRNNKSKPAYEWGNVNMQKLSEDAAHRVNLGLDAMIPNHIHPIPYHNSKTGKYDIDLQIGYKGMDYYRRKMAIDTVKNIRYELVYENDKFSVIKSDSKNEKDHYTFEITSPFDRGGVKGGFGYIEYEDPAKNEVVIVTEEDFIKSKNAAPTKKVWNEWPDRMRYKTLVHRVTQKLDVDPEKVNPSYIYVENQDSPYGDPNMEVSVEQPTERKALDIEPQEGNGEPPSNEGKEEPEKINREELMSEITTHAKQVWGQDDYYKRIKEHVVAHDPKASNMLDLTDDDLVLLHSEVTELEPIKEEV